jgi:4-amino-4-deoxy-L-arabinose transferase-like glycosyltransferase
MTRLRRLLWMGLWAAWALYAAAMLATLPLVPFHPDESTHIFLSNDFDTLVWQLNPAAVTWSAPGMLPYVNHYRLIEAPLSRYLIGLSRTLTGQHAQHLAVDWNWSGDWAANVAAGAVPNPLLLFVARLPSTLGTLFGALLVFAIGRRTGGWVAGVTAAALYMTNGALWLHGRRAMSEGLTIFTILLAVWVILRWSKHAVWVGAAVALATAAKLTGLLLLPAALLAVYLSHRRASSRRQWRTALWLIVSFCLVSLILNPALWAPPAGVLSSMLLHRTTLLGEQVAAFRSVGGPIVDGPIERAVALLYELFLAPLQFWETGNYVAFTAAAETYYQTFPWHTWFRASSTIGNLLTGGAFAILAVAGAAFSALSVWRPRRRLALPGPRRDLVLLAVATAGVLAALFALPIAWQRYYVPLLPLVCVWAGLGLAALVQPLLRQRAYRRAQRSA